MRTGWIKPLAVAAAIGVAASCDRPQPITAPADVPAPRLASIKGFVILDGPAGQWAMLVGSGKAEETQSAIIDQHGGSISFSGTELVVPEGAVIGPTRFTVTMKTLPYLTAQLSAVPQIRKGRSYVDGPELHTFNSHYLTLTIDYARGFKAPNADLIKLLWVVNNRAVEVQETSIQFTRGALVAKLWHFTDYSPGLPRSALDQGDLP